MSNILTTIKKELRGIVRDRKSLMIMLLTPVMIPLFMILFSAIYDSQFNEEETDKSYLIGVNYSASKEEKEILKELHLKTKYYPTQEELDKAYQKKKIHAYIVKDDQHYVVYSNPTERDSLEIGAMAMSYLDTYNSYLGHLYLSQYNVDFEQVDHSILIESETLSGTNELVNVILFLGITFAIMSITLTAVYGVCDTIAGEKERGTLETILTFPIRNIELITGKYLAIVISCIITSIICCFLVTVSFIVSKNQFSIFEGAVINIHWYTVLLALFVMISASFFISGLTILIASFTKSYKEAQSALTPVSFLIMVPMMFTIMDIKLNYPLSFIPLVNHSMLINDVLVFGINQNTIFYFMITVISSLIYSALFLYFIKKLYKNEKILFAD